MEEKAKSRTMQEIQQEYLHIAARAGEAQFQVLNIQKDLAIFNSRLAELNAEALKLKAAEDAAKEVGKVDEAAKS